MKTMENTAFAYGDHHPEIDWYDYEDEIVEPQPPLERYIGIKIKK